VVRFDFLGTTRGGDAGSFVDDMLEEEFECFRCNDFILETCHMKRE
jgi:hypothetical protein